MDRQETHLNDVHAVTFTAKTRDLDEAKMQELDLLDQIMSWFVGKPEHTVALLNITFDQFDEVDQEYRNTPSRRILGYLKNAATWYATATLYYEEGNEEKFDKAKGASNDGGGK